MPKNDDAHKDAAALHAPHSRRFPALTVAAGVSLVTVTAHQDQLIVRLRALRSALWVLAAKASDDTFQTIAANFSTSSARAWTTGGAGGASGPAVSVPLSRRQRPGRLRPSLAAAGGPAVSVPLSRRLAALAGEVHALAHGLETTPPHTDLSMWVDVWYDARRLAFDLAVEAGRVDHDEHVARGEGSGAVVLPAP